MSRKGSCSNPSQTHRDCGLKGGNSRCQQKERKRPRKNQRRKRSTNALVRFTAPKLFGAKTQTLTREENLISPPGFFLIRECCSCRCPQRQNLGSAAASDGGSYNSRRERIKLRTVGSWIRFPCALRPSLCELISHEALSRRCR